jgi:hypothetical protein
VPAQQKAFWKLLQSDTLPPPDVQLLFDEVPSTGGSSQTTTRPSLPAHSFILSMYSSVLRGALEIQKTAADDGTRQQDSSNTNTRAAAAAAASSASCSRCTPLPLPGTSYEQWLQVAPFLYPVTPLPEVGWSNIEGALCHTTCLWSMPTTPNYTEHWRCD